MLGRVKPDIRDVLIAFFGGLALIIARTKKGTIASVIFGVAIATALMPPLCTAGYGLSQGNFDYFFGAMYLFTINTIFIALATFLVLKILRFPMLKYANSQRRKNIARIATLLALTAMLPAGWTFYDVLQETRYEQDYKIYLESEINQNANLWLQREKIDLDEKLITLNFNGEISEATKTDLINELKGYKYLQDFSLTINGNKNRSADKILDLYDVAIDKIEIRDSIITALKLNIDSLKLELSSTTNELDPKEFLNLSKDAKIQFSDLEFFGYAKMLSSSNFRYADTITLVKTKWNSILPDSLVVLKKQALKTWIENELKTDDIEVISD